MPEEVGFIGLGNMGGRMAVRLAEQGRSVVGYDVVPGLADKARARVAGSIAEVAAATGHEVVLRSRSQAGADAMVASLAKALAKQVEKGKRTDAEAAEISSRVRATTHLGELVDVDLVIESVVEDRKSVV